MLIKVAVASVPPVTIAAERILIAALASVAVVGVVSTAGASLIYFGLVRSAGATVTSLVNYLIPPIGVLWGVLVLGERLTAGAIAALALILCGIAAINRQPRRGAT